MMKVTSMIMKLFLPEVSAGACVAEAGCCCNKPGTHKKQYTCLGTCVLTSACRKGPGSGCSF